VIVVTKIGTPETEIDRICDELSSWGLSPEKIVGKHKVVLGLVGETANLDVHRIEELSTWIETVLRVERPFKRASRQYRQNESSTVIVPTPNGDIASLSQVPAP
jgi:3-deoxy-7-phosphoheptulonate synthase